MLGGIIVFFAAVFATLWLARLFVRDLFNPAYSIPLVDVSHEPAGDRADSLHAQKGAL